MRKWAKTHERKQTHYTNTKMGQATLVEAERNDEPAVVCKSKPSDKSYVPDTNCNSNDESAGSQTDLSAANAFLNFPRVWPALPLAVCLCLLSLANDLTHFWIPRELIQLIGVPLLEGLMIYWIFCIFQLHRVMKNAHGARFPENLSKTTILWLMASPLSFYLVPEILASLLQYFNVNVEYVKITYSTSYFLGLCASSLMPHFLCRKLIKTATQFTCPGSVNRSKQILYTRLITVGLSGPMLMSLVLFMLKLSPDWTLLTAAGLAAAFWALHQLTTRLHASLIYADCGFRLNFCRRTFRPILTAMLIGCLGVSVWLPFITKPCAQAELLTYAADFAGLMFGHQAKLRICQKAVSLAPDELFTLMARAECYYQMKNYEKAISDFSTAIRLQHPSRAYRMRGESYAQIGEAERSQQDFKMAALMENIDSNRE